MIRDSRSNLGISGVIWALTVTLLSACNGGPAGPAEPPVTAPPPAQLSADSAFAIALRARLETSTQAGQFSGAVLVMRNEKTLFEGGYGLADR